MIGVSSISRVELYSVLICVASPLPQHLYFGELVRSEGWHHESLS